VRVARALVPALAVLALAGAASPPELVFTDVTAAAGIRFVHNNGAFGKKYLPETLGPGCVFFDFDNDGRPDILLVNSTNWPGHAGPRSHAQLYHNNGDGTFTDVTAGSGLDVELYGMGGAAADYDNDGRADVFISAVGGGRLFHNDGGGKFSDVTAHAGIADKGFSTGVLWFDYDNDGKLDLLVAHYVDWSIDKDLFCTLDGTAKSYCTPES
jgi:enediyne biosynthesis protein E4